IVGRRTASCPGPRSNDHDASIGRCPDVSRYVSVVSADARVINSSVAHGDSRGDADDRRARRDLASKVELPEQGTRPGIERPQLTRAVAHEVHTACDPGGSEAENIALRRRTLPRDGTVRGVEGEDVRWPGERSEERRGGKWTS